MSEKIGKTRKEGDRRVYVNGKPVDPGKADGLFGGGDWLRKQLRSERSNPFGAGTFETGNTGSGAASSSVFGQQKEKTPDFGGSTKPRKKVSKKLVLIVLLIWLVPQVISLASSLITHVGDYFEESIDSFDSDSYDEDEEDAGYYTDDSSEGDENPVSPYNADGTMEDAPYEAPEKLGDSLADGQFQFAGTLYQLPVPIQELENNGWTFAPEPYADEDEESVDETTLIAAMETEDAYLSHGDGAGMYVDVMNFSADSAPAAACAVTDITPNEESEYDLTKLDFKTSGGITMSMSPADLDEALQHVDTSLLQDPDMIQPDQSADDDTSPTYSLYFQSTEAPSGLEQAPNLYISFYDNAITYAAYGLNIHFPYAWRR